MIRRPALLRRGEKRRDLHDLQRDRARDVRRLRAVALVDVEATVRKTGQRVTELDEVHIWHFRDDGLVARFRHRVDTLKQQLAWQGSSAA